MPYLILALHLFLGAALSGTLVTLVLVAGLAGPWWLGGAVLGGLIAAWPLARALARVLGG